MSDAGHLRRDAESAAAPFPNLLVEAERLSASVMHGAHGRKRSGTGETFWQYRPAMHGDSMGAIDWRRSARSDGLFVREMEWEASQTVYIWRDDSPEMDFKSELANRSKLERADLLSLALGIILCRTGERVSLVSTDAEKPLPGETQIQRIAMSLLNKDSTSNRPVKVFSRHSRAIFISDFLGSIEPLEKMLKSAAQQHITGAILQINDPAEEIFPYSGRVFFESMSGALNFETDRADALKSAYVEKLAERRTKLQLLAEQYGWQFTTHRTNQSPQPALLWLNQMLEGARK